MPSVLTNMGWLVAFLAALLVTDVAAQTANAPTEIKGHWLTSARSNSFELKDIVPAADGTFTAKLTWWTLDPKCALVDVPLKGKLTESAISFDVTTKCGVSMPVNLTRSGQGWEGKGTTSGGTPVELKAD
jgi:hypothetical protein